MDDSFFDYKIPEDILAKFPDEFWKAFAEELSTIFKCNIFAAYPENNGDRVLDYIPGTIGWVHAFKKSCEHFGLNGIFEYYDKLEWYDSDLFDVEICSLLEKKYVEKMEGRLGRFRRFRRFIRT